MELSFTDGFNQSLSLAAMNRQCTNCFPKFVENGTTPDGAPLFEKILMGIPGIVQLATSGSGLTQINRGAEVMDGIAYFVNGSSLQRLNADFSLTSLGTIAGSGKVSIAHNGIQLMVLVPGGKGYTFNKIIVVFV